MRTHPVLSRLGEAGVKLGLDRIRQLLAELGDPQLAAPVVHVAGTNGKGSVCAYLTRALVEAGYRVGTYISPHLEHINERVQIDGQPIDDPTLAEAIEALDRMRSDWGSALGVGRDALTYFELMTVVAFQVFAARRVDVAVVEVGLGGRLDATNVVQPVVTAITSIAMDHMDVLGDTIAAIAAEKAGILKPGVPCAVGPVSPEALDAIRRRADQVGAPLWTSGTHLRRERKGASWWLTTPEGRVGPVTLGMQGVHQGANAAVAVGALHLLQRQGLPVPDEAIVRGLATAHMPGRIEPLLPGLIVDGAHNPEGTTALAAWLAEQPRQGARILLFGMGEGREPRDVLGPLLPHVDEVVLTRCAHPKALEPRVIAGQLGQVDVLLSDGGPVEECLAEVYADAGETIVAGSLFLAGAVRELVAAGALEGLSPGMGGGEE